MEIRWLSLSGKILLVRSVLSAIPNYFISVLHAPSSVIKQIRQIITKFLWCGNMSGLRKFPLISLEDMMHDKNCVGVGLHNLALRNKAYGGKLIWQMVNKPNNLSC